MMKSANWNAKVKISAVVLEYGVSQLSSMRASMAKTIWRSIKTRLAWRATPSRSPYDHTVEGYGVHSFERIAKLRSRWLYTLLDEERSGGTMVSYSQAGYPTQKRSERVAGDRVNYVDCSCC